ncbi:hypothetical protein Droror1_Dr00016385, partial [Drosera rotundifolia]
ILEAALQFLLDYEKVEDDDESGASSSEDDATPQKLHVVLNKEDVQKLMTEELLQDLFLYKKSHDKAVSSAARSLVTLFREGTFYWPKARPKAFGEVNVASDFAGIELLKEDGGDDTDGDDNDPTGDGNESDYDSIQANASGSSEGDENDTDANEDVSDDNAKINSESEDDELEEDDEAPVDKDACSSADEADSVSEASTSDVMNDDIELHHDSGDESSIGKNRKLSDFDGGQLDAVDSSYYLISKLLLFKIKTVIV